jgi:hypothetical protein
MKTPKDNNPPPNFDGGWLIPNDRGEYEIPTQKSAGEIALEIYDFFNHDLLDMKKVDCYDCCMFMIDKMIEITGSKKHYDAKKILKTFF